MVTWDLGRRWSLAWSSSRVQIFSAVVQSLACPVSLTATSLGISHTHRT
ncbi:hypothetical protein [Streptomyces sp. NPDC127084]